MMSLDLLYVLSQESIFNKAEVKMFFSFWVSLKYMSPDCESSLCALTNKVWPFPAERLCLLNVMRGRSCHQLNLCRT